MSITSLEHHNDPTPACGPERPVVILDDSSTLVCSSLLSKLNNPRHFAVLSFDPTGSVAAADALEGHAGIQVFSHAMLGDGAPATLYDCLNPAMTSVLKPLPAAKLPKGWAEDLEVCDEHPVATVGLDRIEGLDSIDCLIVSPLSPFKLIFDHGARALRDTLVVDVGIAFQQTHEGQATLEEVTLWAHQSGFRLHRLLEGGHCRVKPITGTRKEDVPVELTGARALYLPSTKRMAALGNDRRNKLAFILETLYGIAEFKKDMPKDNGPGSTSVSAQSRSSTEASALKDTNDATLTPPGPKQPAQPKTHVAVSSSWDTLLNEFRRLGGTADNVVQREGRYGLGLFPRNPKKPVTVHVPDHLLIPIEDILLEGRDLQVREGSAVSPDIRKWFATFERDYSWGANGRAETEKFVKGLLQLPNELKKALRSTGLIHIGDAHQEELEDLVLSQFMRSRRFVRQGQMVSLGLLELINHNPESPGFVASDGIGVRGQFRDEVTVNYGQSDSLRRLLSYGFSSREPLALSVPVKVRTQDNRLLSIGPNTHGAFLKGLPVAPTAEVLSQEVRLPFLLLGSKRDHRMPRALLREALPALETEETVDLFDRVRASNQDILCRILEVAEDVDQPIAGLMRKSVIFQLNALAYAFGR